MKTLEKGIEKTVYMVKNAAGISCTSPSPYLDYSMRTLRSLQEAGYKMYINGKVTKFPTEAEWKAAQVQDGKTARRKREM